MIQQVSSLASLPILVKGSAMKIANINPDTLSQVDNKELTSLNLRMHQLWAGNFAGNDELTVGDLNRENLLNAALFIWAEMLNRGMEVDTDTALWRAAEQLTKSEVIVVQEEPSTYRREEAYKMAEQVRSDNGSVASEKDGGD
jgi:hypothetical protein